MAKTKKRKLPPDPDGMNDDRASWAASALDVFMSETGTEDGDAVCDLLADLRHWCDRNGRVFEAELARGTMHYEAEVSNG